MKSKILSNLLNERIKVGGIIATRSETYHMVLENTQDKRCAQYFAFATPEYKVEVVR